MLNKKTIIGMLIILITCFVFYSCFGESINGLFKEAYAICNENDIKNLYSLANSDISARTTIARFEVILEVLGMRKQYMTSHQLENYRSLVELKELSIRVSSMEQQLGIRPVGSQPYIGKRPIFAWYTEIGQVSTTTRDTDSQYSVSVVMNLGYDSTDTTAFAELSSKQLGLQEFVRRYFAGKSVGEGDLNPENEERLKQEIKEQLNNRYLENARVRDITFAKLDVMEVFE